MNGYERIQAALAGRWPDRPPVMLHNFMPAAREAGYTMGQYRKDPKKIAESFIRSVEKVGRKAHLKGSDGATVISFFQHEGITAFATGFGKSGTLHANDEYAEIPTLYHGARALEQFVRDYDAI